MRHATMLVVILAFVPLASETAQVQQPIERGARVRVTILLPCPDIYTSCADWRSRHNGTFVAWKADTLVVQSNGDTLTVPVTLLTRLDVSRGRKTNTGKGAEIGFLLGGVVGAVIGYASYEECEGVCFGDFGSGFAAFVGGLVGGLGGGAVGALIGSSTKTDRWREVPLDRVRVSLGPQRDGWLGLGASVRF